MKAAAGLSTQPARFTSATAPASAKGISFEEGLAKLADRPVMVFDPSPTALPTIARTDMHNLEFLAVGVSAENGVVEFSVPANPDEGSFSVPRDGLEKVSFECWDLRTTRTPYARTLQPL